MAHWAKAPLESSAVENSASMVLIRTISDPYSIGGQELSEHESDGSRILVYERSGTPQTKPSVPAPDPVIADICTLRGLRLDWSKYTFISC